MTVPGYADTRRPTRIFVDAHVFDGEHQGSRTYLQGLYQALSKVTTDVEVTLAARNIAQLEDCFAGCRGIRFETLRSKGSYARLGYEMPRLIAAGEYDYAHFQYIRPLRAAARVIVTMHDALVFSHPALFPAAFVARSAPLFLASAHASDVLTTVSNFSRDEISRWMLVRKARVHVVPNGVSERYFDQRESSRQAERCRGRHGLGRYIVYVSRFERRKNQHGLVRAWVDAGLPQRGIALLLVGSRRQAYPELKAEIDRLPAETARQLKILEGVSDEDLQGLISGSQGFVYPSLAEGFGIPPLEAAAMQVPVICSNRTAMRDYDFLGDDLFDPADHPAMVGLLQRMIASPPEPRLLARRAEVVRQRYTWQSVASRFLQVLREDAASRQQRSPRDRSSS